MEFLSNPGWQIAINAAIGLLTIIVSIIIYRRQRNRRSITYEVVSDTPILSLKEEIKGRVQVLFDTKPVGEVRLVILKIWNSGDSPILPDEYIEPIKIYFGEKAEILDIDVLETVPNDIKETVKSSLKIGGAKVTFIPFLLNSGDIVKVKALIAQPKLTKEVGMSTRIVGINQMLNYSHLPRSSHPQVRFAAYCSLLLFITSVIYLLLFKYTNSFGDKVSFILTIAISSILYIIVFTVLLTFYLMFAKRASFSATIRYTTNKLFDLLKFMIDDTNYNNRL